MSNGDPVKPGWRLYIGISLFFFGLLSPLCIPLVAASKLPTLWKTALSGLLMLGIPELLWVGAAAVMGKEGFRYIKRKFWGVFKKMAPPDEVGPVRYRIGLVIFSLPLIVGWLEPYVALWIPALLAHQLAISLIADILLLASLFTLGGDFWDKLRGLFIHRAKTSVV